MVGRLDVTLRVHRYCPEDRGKDTAGTGATGRRWTQDYHIRAAADASMLDCLLQIKRTVDPTLAFRYSCGHGMCGSDAVAIDGVPALLCKAKVRDYLGHVPPETSSHAHEGGADEDHDADGFRKTANRHAEGISGRTSAARSATITSSDATTTPATAASTVRPGDGSIAIHDAGDPPTMPSPADARTAGVSTPGHAYVEIAPLAAFAPLRDLIVDIDPMLDAIKRMKPYLQSAGLEGSAMLPLTPEGRTDVFELLQSPEQLAAYEQLTNCIACGVCEGGCPIYLGDKPFVGPAPLVAAMRFIKDSRDAATDERFDLLDSPEEIWACRGLRVCTQHCPRGIDVAGNLWITMKALKARKEAAASGGQPAGNPSVPTRQAQTQVSEER